MLCEQDLKFRVFAPVYFCDVERGNYGCLGYALLLPRIRVRWIRRIGDKKDNN